MRIPIILTALLCAGVVHAQHFRSSPIADDRVHAEYVLGASGQKWATGQFNWYYNPLNQPAGMSNAAVINAIQVAAARWAGMCNISFNFMGTTAALPNLYGDSSTVDQVNVLGWSVLTGADAGYSSVTKTWFAGAAFVDADIVMNPTHLLTLADVEGVLTHEIGHAIGLAHSDVQASVMFADPYHSANYMATLRGDDVKGCSALYGVASTVEPNRAFNWAEAVYPQQLAPSPASSGVNSGYYYRYYPATNSYVGTRDGKAFYMGPDGVIQDLGNLGAFADRVQGAGF